MKKPPKDASLVISHKNSFKSVRILENARGAFAVDLTIRVNADREMKGRRGHSETTFPILLNRRSLKTKMRSGIRKRLFLLSLPDLMLREEPSCASPYSVREV